MKLFTWLGVPRVSSSTPSESTATLCLWQKRLDVHQVGEHLFYTEIRNDIYSNYIYWTPIVNDLIISPKVPWITLV